MLSFELLKAIKIKIMKYYFISLVILINLIPWIKAVSSDEHRQEFERIDLNNDGYLDAQELRLSVTGLSEDDITSIFDFYDKDRDGVICYEEYLNLIIQSKK